MAEQEQPKENFGPWEFQQYINNAINEAIMMYERDCPHSVAKVNWNFTFTDREYLERKKNKGKKPAANGGLFAGSEGK